MFSQKKHNGLMLDIARRYYSVDVIKQYIDTLADSGGGFLHLHFSDHENYGLESRILNQKAESAEISDGRYRNPQTGKLFLSDSQLREIAQYAHAKNIELIPELGSPNHMDGIFTLLTHRHGAEYVQSLKSKMADDEIDITNPQSAAFVESLMEEVIAKFPHSKRFHIGADEFGYSVENHHEFVAYVNRLSSFLAGKGLKTQMWNDGLIKQNLDDLNRRIEVTYWSYDGDAQDRGERDKRRRIRASMPELIQAGFDVWNYNSYYLYFVPNSNLASSGDTDYAVRDVEKNWDLGIWDGDNRQNVLQAHKQKKVRGAALAIWGEHSLSLSDKTVFSHTQKLLQAVMHKAEKTSSD
ncbi:family 20 glycosylhydrolase [Neisseria sp. CCUG12390]|uniref:family 20 glycosylhydrolase n=1 Tax=Neisseria sp. CCUG12390 TaxID=3392035 RepID=UPI003A0FC3B8